ncbi:MAG: hypothetical protein IPP77_03705 [Bacteroidetes bacterium]|nr:hypothetical protein [Bacteroidota bacterium]
MAKKKSVKKARERAPNKPKEAKPNPNHKEDFEKVLRMLVPEVKPKGVK